MSELGTGAYRDPRIPLSSVLLAYGPVVPLPLAALGWLTLPFPWPGVLLWLAVWWGGAILTFLAGVRRGLSFQDAGASLPELALMVWLFVLGAGAIAGALAVRTPLLPLTMLALGYATLAIVDPASARRGRVPAHFETLRPLQMGVALIGLIGLMVEWCVSKVPV
jgi:hypothetical protein